jgi:subtilisin-like proprotein convertase family protein
LSGPGCSYSLPWVKRGILSIVAVLATLAVGVPAASGAQFSSPTAIKMIDGENFLPYPSVIAVSGQRGKVKSVRVTLSQIAHDNAGEVVALLASPSGASTLLFYDSCAGNTEGAPLTLTFDDAAPATLPASSCSSGTYQPGAGLASGSGVPFPYPAPAPPYPGTLAGLAGASPNGVWQLFVRDNAFFVDGEVRGGWSVDLTLSKSCKKKKNRAAAAKKKRCKKKKRN